MLRRDPCVQCGQPVFLAERLIVSSARLLYHRRCFRCARCLSQLALANYYETEDGRFCCETCPDEEKDSSPSHLAPLATEDDISSLEPSRPSSVYVDHDLQDDRSAPDELDQRDKRSAPDELDQRDNRSAPDELDLDEKRSAPDELSDSPDTGLAYAPECDQVIHNESAISDVNSVDKVKEHPPSCKSRETEDDAKDLEDLSAKESLSIVQMRRRLFENEIKKSDGKRTKPREDKSLSDDKRTLPEDDQALANDKNDIREQQISLVTSHDSASLKEQVGPADTPGRPSSQVLPHEDNVQVDDTDKDECVSERKVIAVDEDESEKVQAEVSVSSEKLSGKKTDNSTEEFDAKRACPVEEVGEKSDHPVEEIGDKSGHPVEEVGDKSGHPVEEVGEKSGHPVEEIGEKSDRPVEEVGKKSDHPVEVGEKSDHPVEEVGEKNDNLEKEISEKSDDPAKEISEVTDDPAMEVGEKSSDPAKEVSAKNDDPAMEIDEKSDDPSKEIDEKSDDPAMEVDEKIDHPAKEVGEKSDDPAKEVSEKSDFSAGEITENDDVAKEISEKSDYPTDDISGMSDCPAEESSVKSDYPTEEISEKSGSSLPKPENKRSDLNEEAKEMSDRSVLKTPSPPPKPPRLAAHQPPATRPISYPSQLNPFSDESDGEAGDEKTAKDSTNPFGSSDSEDEPVVLREKLKPPRPPRPPQRPNTHLGVQSEASAPPERVRIAAPANLNPFWDDGDEPDEEESEKLDQSEPVSVTPQKPPVPKPRTVLSVSPEPPPRPPQASSPFPERSGMLRCSGRFGSSNSLSSVVSSASTMRRKKHAAPPPPTNPSNTSTPSSTISPAATSTPGRSASFSPGSLLVPSSPTPSGRSTLGRSRKAKRAPLPPCVSPITSKKEWDTSSSLPSSDPPSLSLPTELTPLKSSSALENDESWLEGKCNKDEINRIKQNRLSAALSGEQREEVHDDSSFHHSDKSSHGQWKRKKGPAPPRPIPQRRQIRAIPLKELKRELDDIEVLQLELERQGVDLERKIRRKFDENPDASECSMTPDVEDLILQLFELVNEKNELFRKQAELMYLRRQQRLEEEHADLEYQIRCLMERPEKNKTDNDKAKEEKLIQRLVEVVERRNEIVECLEMDRLREAEEDHSIHTRLELFATKTLALNDAYINDLYKSTPALTCCARKEKKKKKDKDKTKKGTLRLNKKDKQMDADKDIDETEVEQSAKEKTKTKRKWF